MFQSQLFSFTVLVASFSSPTIAASIITWNPEKASASALVGTTTTLQVTFTATTQLSDVEIAVGPSLTKFISVSPSHFSTVPPGVSQQVSIRITVEKETRVRSVLGVIALHAADVDADRQDRRIAESLRFSLSISKASVSSIPATIAIASLDRVVIENSLYFVRDEIDIHFHPKTPTWVVQQIATSIGGVILGSIPELDTYQVMVDTTGYDNLSALISQLQTTPSVDFATHNTLRLVNMIPNDPGTALSYGPQAIRLPQAWDLTTGAATVPIGILDTVFDFTHPDLVPNVVEQNAYTGQIPGSGVLAHGTRVASIIGAKGNNGIGIAGVMWNAALYLYGTVDPFVFPYLNDNAVQLGALQAINAGVRVINYSAGSSCGSQKNEPSCNSTEGASSLSEEDKIFRNLISYANSKGRDVLWVFAIANNHEDVTQTSPARLAISVSNAISVAAVDGNNNLSSFSGYGFGTTIAAPGVNIYSDAPGGGFDNLASGTSFATPFVTGVAGLMLSVNPGLTASQLKATIRRSAQHTGNLDPAGNEILLLDAFAAVSSTARFTITDLGAVSGYGTIVSPSAINASGQVVGVVLNGNTPGCGRAFSWSGGVLADLGTAFTEVCTEATGINDLGQISVSAGATTFGQTSAYILSGGVASRVPFPGGVPLFSFAASINNLGAVVGDFFNGSSDHAYLYDGHGVVDLGTLPGFTTTSSALAVNQNGQVVGSSTNQTHQFMEHAFVYTNGVMTDLGTLPGMTQSAAVAINDAGSVVGSSYAASGASVVSRAFVYSNGIMHDLGTLGGSNSGAAGINNSGQIVGSSVTGSGTGHAFLYMGGTMTDLNTLITPGSGWELGGAIAINNSGQIVGVGTHNGQRRAVLLTPQ